MFNNYHADNHTNNVKITELVYTKDYETEICNE